MDLFSKEQLTELAALEGEPCVSIYMPTYHVESELSQNPIRLKNLLKTARRELAELDYRDTEIDALLEPLVTLTERNAFWLDQSDGFAAFLTPDEARFYRLPVDFDEFVFTGTRFHIKPLFPLLAANNEFYVLALSQNKVRLFQGTHYSMSEIESKDLPENLVDVLSKEEFQRSLQIRTANVAGGRQDAIYHGSGANSDDEPHRPHDQLIRFFHGVDEGVRSVLKESSAPLVLAGVEYYLPIYREVNGYGNLVEDSIVAGNPDHVKPKEMHAKAWDIVEPRFMETQRSSLDRFQQLRGNGDRLASDDIREVLPAAVFGRIDTLFIEIGSHLWGRYDADDNSVDLHDEHEAGDDDLLDLAAVHTVKHGGTVHALKSESMPTNQNLAASFRYPADVAAADANHV